ncbi:unnamed protein product [Didymodactylos carnosus]|uniref:Uncharacterized protein n=1 Tax=Didymodactylos carnosus TaxID=1234261 RepID=A0A814IKE5_9BILA|nr:unnamed protein product [Didymodactylos carnosus]CAF1025599.1 unnamed protein product [Didymodactylos carnosus]CAF3722425.1 unnamed protein product [Didymodactylos carnosus]CAF3796786.1 unnamed protein product [Didymodactylos carnosus]
MPLACRSRRLGTAWQWEPPCQMGSSVCVQMPTHRITVPVVVLRVLVLGKLGTEGGVEPFHLLVRLRVNNTMFGPYKKVRRQPDLRKNLSAIVRAQHGIVRVK